MQMKNINKKSLLIFTLFFIISFGYSQANEIKIKFIGNCGLYLTDGKLNIYVDFPYKSGAHNYMEYDKSELDNIKENPIFIFTHKHSDHYSGKLLKKLNGKKYGPWNISKLEELNDTVNDFSIQAFKTKHRYCLNHYSYLITWHHKKIFLSGDTESAETIGTLSNIDWAFVPSWIIIDSYEKDIEIDAKKFGVYHLYPNEKITNDNPEKYKLLNKQGEVISIPYKE